MISGELEWWQRVISSNTPSSLCPLPQPTAHLFTDASPSGWGGWLHQDNTCYHAFGSWPESVKNQTNNFREMLAVSTAIKSFLSRMILHTGIHLRIHSDNSSTVFNIQRRAASRNLFHPLRDLFNLCDKNDLVLTAQHVKGTNNGVADSLSRLSRSGDYSLNAGLFQQMCDTLDVRPDVDLFATSNNKQLPVFISPNDGDNTPSQDALAVNWSGSIGFIHPPIPLLGKCLRKILQENAAAVIVLPNWKGQSWNTLLGRMSKKMMILGKSEEVLTKGRIMIRKGDKLPPGYLAAHLLHPPYIL
jgi:hypothetical protein